MTALASPLSWAVQAKVSRDAPCRLTTGTGAGKEAGLRHDAGRRAVLALTLTTLAPTPPSLAAGGLFGGGATLSQQLAAQQVSSPGVAWSLSNNDKQLYYPPWLEGEWEVEASLRGVTNPMGRRFITRDTPGVTKASLIAVLCDVGKGQEQPVVYRARFVPSALGVVADRTFNITEQANAFLAYDAVRSVEPSDGFQDHDYEAGMEDQCYAHSRYDPVKNPTRVAVVYATPRRDQQGEDLRKAELFINNREAQPAEEGNTFACSELYRQLVQSSGYGNVFDYEAIWEFRLVGDGRVEARQRVAAFLQPQDPAYFDVGSKAVALYDYSLKLTAVARS